jgi:hypothetical protein
MSQRQIKTMLYEFIDSIMHLHLIKLRERCRTAFNPVFGLLIGGQVDGDDEVGREA